MDSEQSVILLMKKILEYKTIGWDMHKLLIRYRPHISLPEIIVCLNDYKNSYLCHPIYRNSQDPVRQLINRLQNNDFYKEPLSEEYQLSTIPTHCIHPP